MKRGITLSMSVSLAGWLLGGCAAAPRAQLAASEGMEHVAASLRVAIDEYGRDLEVLDARRQDELIDSFIERVRASTRDEVLLAQHIEDFRAALGKIDTDRWTARRRQLSAIENLEVLEELAEGVRRLALETVQIDEASKQFLAEVASRAAGATNPFKRSP